MADTIHFRCTFDFSPRPDASGAGFVEVVEEIARWIRTKEGSGLKLSPSWLMREGNARRADGKSSVTVDSIWGESAVSPDFWALRYEHQDVDFQARRWCIDFGIVRGTQNTWRLAATVGNSLRANYLGREPGHLPATAPRVIKDLVLSPRLSCVAGSTPLKARPVVVEVGKAHHLVRALEDRERGCPVVYVSRARVTGEPLLDPERLAGTIVGAGVVYVAAHPDVDEELEFLMVPKEFRSPNGMIRVYAPGIDFSFPAQSFRHRYFTRAQVEELTAAEVEGQIARALTRRQGWATIRSSVTSVDDVASRRRELRRAELQNQSDATSKSELLKLFEEENVRLSEEMAELRKQKEALDQDVDERDSQVESLRERLRKEEYQSDYFRKEWEKANQNVSAMGRAVEVARSMGRLPDSLTEVVDVIERLHGDTVVFAEAARQGAAASTFDDPRLAWECLHSVATVLHELAFGDEPGKDLGQEFRNRTGFELSLTEGKLTKKDAKLVGLRKVVHDGRDWDITAHIKHGSKAPKCLRVHFAIDREQRRIIVGHCGDHLTTAGTRRRH